MKSIWSTDLANHWPWIQSAHFTLTRWCYSNQKVQHFFPLLIRKFSTYLTFPLWLLIHPAFNCTWHFPFEHLWPLCKIPFFCICHNRSEISANITAICNDIAGWVILQVKHSNANVSVLHHRATVTLIENLENYWTVKVASSLWEISRGQLNRPSLIWNS